MTPLQAEKVQAMNAAHKTPEDEVARRMRYWSASKLAKELALRDINTSDPQAIAWAAALEAERKRRYG